MEDSQEATTTEEAAQAEIGELKAQVKYIVQEGRGDTIRQEVYLLARLGQLTRADIVLLEMVRDEEDK